FVYITDANYISPEEKEKIKGCKTLVLNALRKEPHPSHYTLDEAIALVNELQPQQAYFTHLSHQMGLHAEISKDLPENIKIAYDGLKVPFSVG
ncbi:MAG: MBL fold metallo-hydrolase, partial [Flavobacteriales bacterium]